MRRFAPMPMTARLRQIISVHLCRCASLRSGSSATAGSPTDVIRAKCAPYLHHGQPIRRTNAPSILTSASSRSSRPSFGVSRSTTAGVQPSSPRPAQVRHGAVVDQDPGPQVPDQGHPGLPPLPCRTRHRARSTPWPAGHRAPRSRATAAGGAVGRHQPGPGDHASSPPRPPVPHLEQPPVRGRSTAAGRRLRTMRINGTGRGAPRSRPQGPQPQGAHAPT
jgi:hypothetical protein